MLGILATSCSSALPAALNGPPNLSRDTLYLRAACPFATVWEFAIDGRPLLKAGDLWGALPPVFTMKFAAAPGRHALDWTRWAPTISAHSGPLDTVATATIVLLPCAVPDTLGVAA